MADCSGIVGYLGGRFQLDVLVFCKCPHLPRRIYEDIVCVLTTFNKNVQHLDGR